MIWPAITRAGIQSAISDCRTQLFVEFTGNVDMATDSSIVVEWTRPGAKVDVARSSDAQASVLGFRTQLILFQRELSNHWALSNIAAD